MSHFLPLVVGTLHPAVGVVFAKGVGAFSELDPHTRRIEGDRHALYFFIIALVAFTTAIQYFCLSSASALLTSKLRTLSFGAILRQDSMLCILASGYGMTILTVTLVEFFDKEENKVCPTSQQL
jgi:hypothetical protein